MFLQIFENPVILLQKKKITITMTNFLIEITA